jgi:hypothetical protein
MTFCFEFRCKFHNGPFGHSERADLAAGGIGAVTQCFCSFKDDWHTQLLSQAPTEDLAEAEVLQRFAAGVIRWPDAADPLALR